MQDIVLRPFFRLAGSLFALLTPDVAAHSGEYYSQRGMYRDRAANQGGWPLRSPNRRRTMTPRRSASTR